MADAGSAWVRAFYDSLDSNSLDVDRWLAKFFHADAVLMHSNLPVRNGHAQIREYVQEQFDRTTGRHLVKHVDVIGDRMYVECEDVRVVKNDPEQKELRLKELVVFRKRMDEDKLAAMEIYSDATPLVERIKAFP